MQLDKVMNEFKKDIERPFMLEKENIIKEFFNIKSNANTKELKVCKDKCKLYLKYNPNNYDIKNLIKVINAEIIYFAGNKDTAREVVIDYWYELCAKDNLSFYEIKILSIIMFIAPDIDNVIDVYEDLLIQLENYKTHKDYLKTKLGILTNFSYWLLEYKHTSTNYRYFYDSILLNSLNKILDDNIDYKINNKFLIALASIRKGIFLKDRHLVYISLILLNEVNEDEELDELIKSYTKLYNISI